MKVDLHCHTKQVLPSDGKGRQVTPELFASKIASAQVKIAAVTNHNHFDLKQFNELAQAVEGMCDLWPGVELTMKGEHVWHLIVVCSPAMLREFNDVLVSELLTCPAKDAQFEISDVVRAVDHLDLLYIPHGHGKNSGRKSRAIPPEKMQELAQSIRNPKRIIVEPGQRSLGVLSKNGYRVIIGSDVKDWNEYESNEVADFRFQISSFTAFCKLVEGDVSFYNQHALNESAMTKIRVKPVERSKERILSVYKGTNIIFGQKGTGKSKLIEAMHGSLINQGMKSGLYKSGQVRELYERECEIIPSPDDAACLGIEDYKNYLEKISNWQESSITSFSDYVEYKKGTRANKNRNRLVIADCGRNLLFGGGGQLSDIKKDLIVAERLLKDFKKVHAKKYLSDSQYEKLEGLLKELYEGIIQQRKHLLVEKYSVQLFNFSIESIKRSVEKLCETPSAPEGTGFTKFASSRIDLKITCNSFLEELDGRKKDDSQPFGYIDNKGQIDLITRRLMFKDDGSPAAYFGRKKTCLNNIRKKIRSISMQSFSPNIAGVHKELASQLEQEKITSLSDFVGVKRFTALHATAEEYEPSDGELAIIMMKRFLSNDFDFYLMDEPERGMGNSYVDKNIRRDEVMKLADSGKVVIMATHNANLAVRTKPVYSMLLEYHGRDNFEIYAGSPFSDVLFNVDNPEDFRSWSKESMEILEGGHDAFYDRKGMYELS